MKWSFEERGRRGIYVFAEPPRPEIKIGVTFYMAFRAVDEKCIEQIRQTDFPEDCPITISTRTGMRYCPWCGVKLEKFYKRNYHQLIDERLSAEFPL